MAYELLTDDEIIKDLGEKLDLVRRQKEMPSKELIRLSGTNHDTLDRFFNGRSGVSLKTFIRLLRGLDMLDKIEKAFVIKQEYSPLRDTQYEPKKRIYKKRPTPQSFVWKEDK